MLGSGWLLTDGPLKDLGTSEESVNKSLESSRTSFWDAITLVFSWTGATVSIIGVCLVVVVLVWWRTKQWWFAVVPLIAISLQAMVFFFTTLLIDRERPDVEKLDDSPPTSSFPSGHTGAATGLYFTLALMALRIRNPCCAAWWSASAWRSRSWSRRPGSTAGMHHLSDVLVAMVNGAVAALLAWCWLRRDDGRGAPSHGGSDARVAGPREGVDAVRREAERDAEQDDRAGGQVPQRLERRRPARSPCPPAAGSRR